MYADDERIAYLVEEAIPMVEWLAKKFIAKYGWGKYRNQLEYDELVQRGALGAALAARNYRLSRGGFQEFAYKAILGQMEELVRRKNLQWVLRKGSDVLEIPSKIDLERDTDAALVSAMLERMVNSLSAREQLILRRYYFDQHSQREICEAVDLGESQVSKVRRTALNKLRQMFASNAQSMGLREVLNR